MIYQSTFVRLTATTLQRWLQPVLRQSQAPSWRFRVSYWTTRGIRYTAKHVVPYDEPVIPAEQGGLARIGLSKLSSDRASLGFAVDLKHLEAYKYSIEHLSIDDAKVTLANDEAGNRVVHCFETEGVNQQIKRNHPENGTLLELISDILIGAGRLKKIESWLAEPLQLPRGLSDNRSIRSAGRWKSDLYVSILHSLIWWHPQGAMDDALDYFSNTYDQWLASGFKRVGVSQVRASVTIGKIMTNRELLCISSSCYDRCLATTERFLDLVMDCFPQRDFELARIKLNHPFNPDPDPFLNFVREVESDPLHNFRFSARMDGKYKPQALYYAMVRDCQVILKSRGRAGDGLWLYRAFDKLWGSDSGYLDTEDPLSKEARQRWLDHWAEKHYPDLWKKHYTHLCKLREMRKQAGVASHN
ncbi:hypothetical protein PG996_015207 [Apiospora saccharicola]|uniref:Uncharacterized protein n=1 Tax=Apiospora saccharicola TaxID=335842 RepID=A0ABR1TKH1_9PEZI